MKSLKVIEDSSLRPELFIWNGPIESDRLAAWLRRHGLDTSCPKDLQFLWQVTGGGDIFESETLLGPFGNVQTGDDVIHANEFLRRQGLPGRFLVFFVGLSYGAIDTVSGDYVELESENFRVRRHFRSLDDWYVNTARADFGRKYGLP
jgi:hypothetical protein